MNNPVSYTDPFGLAPNDKCERCPEGPQKCFDNCNEDYVWCQLTRGRVDGAVCLLQGPTQSRHGPITWPGDTCGLNFDADMCLHNKQWCHFGCRSKCYGPYPPTIKPPFVGPTHHTEVPWWKFWAS